MNRHPFYSKALYDGNRRGGDAALVARTAGDREKGLLRFLTCGSVDDGKSTLIGRLLFEAQQIHEDQLATLEADSRRFGTTGEETDLALLVDGLEDERQQGITIDVAYRYFTTRTRAFVVADTPGHVQYTRNMATGASNADVAVILVDARKGVLSQTKRHATICSLLGIRHIVLAVNKIDLVDYDESVFDGIVSDFTAFAGSLSFASVTPIPVSARFGDNVCAPSRAMPWYGGDTLLHRLETIDVETDRERLPFRLAVQWVARPDLDFRGYCGTVGSGRVRVGDPVLVATSGRRSTIARIIGADGDVDGAGPGDAVTVTLADEVDVSRGDVLCTPDARPSVADQFSAHLVWMAEEPMLPGRRYLMRMGTRVVPATVTTIKHRLDGETLGKLAGTDLGLNEIGQCNLSTASPVAFDPYAENPETGGFILIDRFTHATVAVGMVSFALRRATNIHLQHLSVDKAARARLKGQTPTLLWFTGLSGSGKSSIADLVERRLLETGQHTYILDGDNVRHGLNRDLGFTEADRVENIRRVGEVAKLMLDSGLVVIASFISPFAAERAMVRELVAPGEFVEVFVDTPIEECMARDPKGLYAKARRGEIKNFTGFDSPYEAPGAPELHLRTSGRTPEELADEVIALLRDRAVVG
jgi:bifunctional enzyme CysN/CysC